MGTAPVFPVGESGGGSKESGKTGAVPIFRSDVKTAIFRFYAELNDFLPRDKRAVTFPHAFSGRQTVKHLIEVLGVPHTEVDLILVNGQSVSFSYLPDDGDRVSVYPMFEAMDISPVTRLRPRPLRQTRFIVDSQLGRLARHLRMLGFDTLHRNDYRDQELVQIAVGERRTLLTKDRGLLKRAEITHAYYVREPHLERQLLEVVERFDLADSVAPFQRCMVCNQLLVSVAKKDVFGRVPPKSRERCDEFWECPGCRRLYWNGSHRQSMERLMAKVLQQARSTQEPDGSDTPHSEGAG